MTQRTDRQDDAMGRCRPARRRPSVARALAGIVLASSGLWLAPAPAGADVGSGSNPAVIAVPAGGTTQGPASPYPSPISISGLSGTVSDVNVTLTNFTHAIATDVDVLLVGPAGENVLLMSDVKGDTGFPINNATLTFDDSAADVIPATGAVVTGTFKPTNRLDSSGPDVFPAPAPAPSNATALSVFNGTNPNGTWNLFVFDDAGGDTGSIAGGWSITVTTSSVAQPGAIQFTTGSFRGVEGGGTVSLTLQRVGGSAGAVSVTIATTTPATATAGSDFTALDQTVTFADGQTTATVPLTIIDDSTVEGVDETVTVALSAPTGGATLGSPSTAVVRIDDNDATFDTTPIVIPGSGSGQPSGAPATPYPATIDVSGQPTTIGGVEVTLTGFTHAVPIDVDILLVGPTGENVVLMSDVGGQSPVAGVNLTFSDAAASTIPAPGPLPSGTFRPSDDDSSGVDAFPAPAPAPSTATSLAAFVGTNPNGTWSLFVVDDASGDVGQIAGGWSLRFLPAPPTLDHFMLYKVKPIKDSPKFASFAPVTLADQLGGADYQVVKPSSLGLPADKNGGGVVDSVTHLADYTLKLQKGAPKFQPIADVEVANQCNALRLEISKPASILVPSLKSLVAPPPPPGSGTHEVDHYLCYKAKVQTKLADGTKLPKFPKGLQVVAADQFQSRRYDLTKITRLCNPVDKSGSPVLVSGPDKGQPLPITPASIRHPGVHLVCYQAKLAKALIPQTGCGPTTPDDRGTTIEPAQPKHVPVEPVFVNNQFGPQVLATIKEAEFCIPSMIGP